MNEEELKKVLAKPGKKFLIEAFSIQQLVGEFKICVQRLMEGIKYTEQELKDTINYIAKWEEKLYPKTVT